jgi:hypothetical protein
MTDGMGMDKESPKAVSKAAPGWVKDTLDDPTLKATVAAGEAEDAADSLAEPEGLPAQVQVAQTQEPTRDGQSAQLPTPAPAPAAPPPVPDWAKAGGNAAAGTRSGTASSAAGKVPQGNGKPPPVPAWAKDFVADS